VSPYQATGSPATGPRASAARPRERVISVPVWQLFAPGSDPSGPFPAHDAAIEGYSRGPEGETTMALVASGPRADAILDEFWRHLERAGAELRRRVAADAEGRAVLVLAVRAKLSPATSRHLRDALLLPVGVHAGTADLRIVASPEEADGIEKALRSEGIIPSAVRDVGPAVVEGEDRLTHEDWAFLGLLCTLHVFDGPRTVPAQDAAEMLGIEEGAFDEKVRAVESGMKVLGAGLFSSRHERGLGDMMA
jgi:hypothetical protein